MFFNKRFNKIKMITNNDSEKSNLIMNSIYLFFSFKYDLRIWKISKIIGRYYFYNHVNLELLKSLFDADSITEVCNFLKNASSSKNLKKFSDKTGASLKWLKNGIGNELFKEPIYYLKDLIQEKGDFIFAIVDRKQYFIVLKHVKNTYNYQIYYDKFNLKNLSPKNKVRLYKFLEDKQEIPVYKISYNTYNQLRLGTVYPGTVENNSICPGFVNYILKNIDNLKINQYFSKRALIIGRLPKREIQ